MYSSIVCDRRAETHSRNTAGEKWDKSTSRSALCLEVPLGGRQTPPWILSQLFWMFLEVLRPSEIRPR